LLSQKNVELITSFAFIGEDALFHTLNVKSIILSESFCLYQKAGIFILFLHTLQNLVAKSSFVMQY
jgi:hypothetical protein